MKYRTTARALREGTLKKNLIQLGYCELQELLSGHEPTAYTCGVYGWNFDVYELYGKTICTGYRGMPGGRPDAELIHRTERQAEELLNEYRASRMTFDEYRMEKEKLLQEFCERA